MSDEIKVGDLVMVVRGKPCCGDTSRLGVCFVVAEIWEWDDAETYVCDHCEEIQKNGILACEEGDNEGDYLSMLKRIDPPAVNDEVETQRELTV